MTGLRVLSTPNILTPEDIFLPIVLRWLPCGYGDTIGPDAAEDTPALTTTSQACQDPNRQYTRRLAGPQATIPPFAFALLTFVDVILPRCEVASDDISASRVLHPHK